MRATLARCAILAVTVVAFSGCRSGSGWTWGRKNAASTGPALGSANPQLPSLAASPPGYSANGAAGAALGYPDTGAANPYQSVPYGAQPTAYNNPQAAGGYAGVNPPGACPPGTACATMPVQNGPYNEVYGAPTGNVQQPYANAGQPTGGYQPPAAQNNYQAAADPAQGAYGGNPSAADPYANGNNAPPTSNGAPAENYGGYGTPANQPGGNYAGSAADPVGNGNYQPSSSQPYNNGYAADRYATPPVAEPSAPDRYTVSNQPAGGPPADNGGYQPGTSSYQPGNTGYSPPGVPPYEMPGQPNVVTVPQRAPRYRPGGTTDYVPGGGAHVATAPSDRYSPPPSGGSAGVDPYAAPPTDAGGQGPYGAPAPPPRYQ